MENQGISHVRRRGNVKWQAFKSVAEQLERIEQMLEEQNKTEKPLLTNDSKERMQQSLEYNEEIFLSYYRKGYLHQQYITVTSIDLGNKLIHCLNAFNTHIQFELIKLKTPSIYERGFSMKYLIVIENAFLM